MIWQSRLKNQENNYNTILLPNKKTFLYAVSSIKNSERKIKTHYYIILFGQWNKSKLDVNIQKKIASNWTCLAKENNIDSN